MSLDPLHLTVEQVLRIHEAVLHAHGGSRGLRDLALLEASVAAPRATFGGESVFDDLVEIAAAYLFYLCKNHAFVDGNKRVALASSLLFARVNGLSPSPDGRIWEDLVLDVAASRLDRQQTTDRLRTLVTSPRRRRPAAKRTPARSRRQKPTKE